MTPLLRTDKDVYLCDAIRNHGFVPGKFTGTSSKREILKVDIPPLMRRNTELRQAIGTKMAGLYLRNIAPHRPAAYLGGISEGGDILTEAFNAALLKCGYPKLPVFNFPKGMNGQPAGAILNGFYPTQPGARAIIIDDVLTHAGSALRCINTAREAYGISITDFLTLVLRHENGVVNLKMNAVEPHHAFTVGQVISKTNAEGWKAFYGSYPLGYPPKE